MQKHMYVHACTYGCATGTCESLMHFSSISYHDQNKQMNQLEILRLPMKKEIIWMY